VHDRVLARAVLQGNVIAVVELPGLLGHPVRGNADVVLNGHLHNYSRFAPQDASGHVDAARGVRQFIVGTGGRSLFSLDGTKNVEKTAKAYGLLEIRLRETSYNWKFVNTSGTILDSGTASCH
jgi:hypothetical protein